MKIEKKTKINGKEPQNIVTNKKPKLINISKSKKTHSQTILFVPLLL